MSNQFWNWIDIDPISVINNFSEYLEKQISLKEKILSDLENNTNSQYATKEVIEFYRGALIELNKLKRAHEIAKLGEKLN